MSGDSDHYRLQAFARLVREMRDLQKEYFDTKRRRPDTLAHAGDREREVDRFAAAVLGAPEPTLFPDPPPAPDPRAYVRSLAEGWRLPDQKS